MNVNVLRRVGLAGLLGALLLLASAWCLLAWLPQQRAKVDELASQGRRMRHDLLAKASVEPAGEAHVIRSPDQAWQALWQALPSAEQRMPLQMAVLSAAKGKGLLVSAVQYRGSKVDWAAQPGAVLWRQQLSMPVEGSYGAVRAWLTQILKEPALSIDELDLQRADVGSDQVKAHVGLSLWWRKLDKVRP
jgi:hypothetical protein